MESILRVVLLCSVPLTVLALILVVWPGPVLRVLVLAYPKKDVRRRELLAEFHSLPHGARPWWVVQQLETAVRDGLPTRWNGHDAAYRSRRWYALSTVSWLVGLGLSASHFLDASTEHAYLIASASMAFAATLFWVAATVARFQSRRRTRRR